HCAARAPGCGSRACVLSIAGPPEDDVSDEGHQQNENNPHPEPSRTWSGLADLLFRDSIFPSLRRSKYVSIHGLSRLFPILPTRTAHLITTRGLAGPRCTTRPLLWDVPTRKKESLRF